MIEVLVILYFKYMNVDPHNPDKPDRDRFILSKGHGGVGFAPVLARKGYFDFDLLKTFNRLIPFRHASGWQQSKGSGRLHRFSRARTPHRPPGYLWAQD
ncbi:MAG: hypothetical protein R2860_02255 [Desulfobacterales bacterium]